MIERDADGRYAGQKLTFRYFVGTEYDGMRYTVTIDEGGSVTRITGIVTDGYIEFEANNTPSTIQVDLEVQV